MTQILHPGQKFPDITAPTLGGDPRKLAQAKDPNTWEMIIVYRGAHCPLCTRYLKELDDALEKFADINVSVMALFADNKDQAAAHMTQVEPRFDIGYDLSIAQMEQLGLFISGTQNGQNVLRPFAEPGLFVVGPDGNIRILDVSNVPFARPSVASLLMGLNYLRNNDGAFPINGTYAA